MTENSTSDWWRGLTFDAEEVIKRIESPDLGFIIHLFLWAKHVAVLLVLS